MKIVAAQVLHSQTTKGLSPLPNVLTKYGHLCTPLPSDPVKTRLLAKSEVHYIPPGTLAMGGAPPHFKRSLPLVSVSHTKEVYGSSEPHMIPQRALYRTSTSLPNVPPPKNKPFRTLVKAFE